MNAPKFLRDYRTWLALALAACAIFIFTKINLSPEGGSFGPDSLGQYASLPSSQTTSTGAAPTAHAGVPLRLIIPSIGVDAPIVQVGITKDGAMGSPATVKETGWYAPGIRPGDAGNAVIDGHLDSVRFGFIRSHGVFWDLGKLQKGDVIQVQDDKGALHTFRVTESAPYGPNDAPLQKIFGAAPGGEAHLNLITCAGDWNPAVHSYSQRLVVFAKEFTGGG